MYKQQYLNKLIVKALYIILLVIIIIGTSFFENYAIVARHNVNYMLPNIIFYALALLVCIMLLFWKSPSVKCMLIIPILLSCLSLVIALWFPVDLGADFMQVHKFAVLFPRAFSEDKNILYHFQTFPFQINDATIYGILYKITGIWRSNVLFGTLSVITASIISASIVYKLTKNLKCAIMCLTLILCLCALNPRCFIPYSDNIGMPFVCLILFLYFTKSEYKWLFILITTGVGYVIKPTVAIPTIAIILIEIFTLNIHNTCKPQSGMLGLLLMIITVVSLPQIIKKGVHFTPAPEKQLGLSFFLFEGQNTATYGTVNGQDFQSAYSIYPVESRDKELIKLGIQRIEERGIANNIKFYIKKIIVSHKDGLFNYQYRYFANDSEIAKKESVLLGKVMTHNGKYFQYYVGFMQTIWNTILLLMLIGSVVYKTSYSNINNLGVLQLTILGVITYTLLFENRAKYLFMFLPIYGILSSLSLYYIRQFIKKRI